MTEPEKKETKPAAKPQLFHVVDTTATPDDIDGNGKTISGARVHEQLVDGVKRSFRFEHGKPLAMPKAIAMKFLRHDSFRLTNEEGEPIEFKRAPRQPDELGAGERLVLKPEETVARLDELSIPALQQRVLPHPGGEKFAAVPAKADRASLEAFRGEMVQFLLDIKAALAKANTSRERDVGAGEFTPEAELGDGDFEDAA